MRTWYLMMLVGLACGAAGQVPTGAPIKLMLLREIGSGSSYPGDVVPLVVTEDVASNGRVLIPEGTMAFAKITKTRREGALSATVFDKPARLCLTFEHMRDVDGNEVNVRPSPGRDGDLQITREMTASATPEEAKEIQVAWENTTTRPVMDKLRKLFSDQATSFSVKEAQVLIQHNVQMPLVQDAIRQGVFGEALNMVRDIKRGRILEAALRVSPLTRPALVAFRAVRELGRISGGVSTYIGGRFKGRNIRCGVGVEFTVYAG